MTTHRSSGLPSVSSSLPAFLPGLLSALLSALLVPAHAASAATEQTEIYQQRGVNGGVVLTDRPSPSRTTERVWQLERENPAAAQQRAEAVRREARVVSERVQRRLDAEREWASETDLEHRRLAGAEPDREVGLAGIDGEYRATPFFYAPFGYSPGPHFQAPYGSPHLGQGRFDQQRYDQRRFDGRQTEGGRFDGRIGTRPRFYSQPNPALEPPRPTRKYPHAATRRADRPGRPADEER